MSTMIRLHTTQGLTEADLKCFFDWQNRRRCAEPRRPGSIYDSEPFNRIIASRGDGLDPRPCGHHAAVDEGDKIEVGEDTWQGHQAVSDLFEWGGRTRTLTPELRDEILQLSQANPEYDKDLIDWLEAHLGQEIFRIHW